MADITMKSIADMSDDDLLNLDPSTLGFNAEEPADDPAEPDEPTDPVEEVDPADPVEPEDDENEPNPDEPDPVDPSDDPTPVDPKPAEDAPEVKAPAKAKVADKEVKEPVVAEDAAIKDFHSKITAPFKANGREIKVESAEEAIQLMQMGANYNKKMAALRPNLQLMKSLETAGLLSQDKIDFLIDVMAKKPEAISKLVQDSGIDPLDISTEKADNYAPTSYKVSDKSLALDDVLDELKGTEHYAQALGFIAETVDEASRKIVADNPEVIRKLHKHMEDGVFEPVWAEVERQRTFNNLSGLSDLEAYRQVGDAMAKSGALEHVLGKANPTSQQVPPAVVIVPPKPKQADDSDRRSKRQGMAPTKAATPSSNKLPADFNPLAMSDEEIARMDISKFR